MWCRGEDRDGVDEDYMRWWKRGVNRWMTLHVDGEDGILEVGAWQARGGLLCGYWNPESERNIWNWRCSSKRLLEKRVSFFVSKI